MAAQGLLTFPSTSDIGKPETVERLIDLLGFVQIDTINTVDRAHHLILSTRLPAYRPAELTHLLEIDRRLFEHWTHDASLIPLKWFAHWRPRFRRSREKGWHRRQLGDNADRVVRHVLSRVRREGPLMSRDFEHDGPRRPGGWWSWKPQKVALDYLWVTGRLFVVGRREFQKVYDLTERAVPEHHKLPAPREAEHVEWACATALDRLGTASARELARFWNAITAAQATRWLLGAVASGRVVPVSVESADGSGPRAAYAWADVEQRIARLPQPPPGMRLLCPFDPVLRDRERALRLFNFHYRFEAFTPAAKRVHGYYVMPILQGDRLVGRADPRFDRARGVLEVRSVCWEPGVRITGKLRAGLEEAAGLLAAAIGAAKVDVPSIPQSPPRFL